VLNENYAQPEMPEGATDGILRGMHPVRKSTLEKSVASVRLLGSGSILNETIKAAELLEEAHNIAADVWSVTSYKALHRDAEETDRWNRLHPDQPVRQPYIVECLGDIDAPVIASSDYVKALPEIVTRWIDAPTAVLGTDGFGRSDGREALRDFFEVDARHIAYTAIVTLARDGAIEAQVATQVRDAWEIDAEKENPLTL
jgi:pyruvate dehydrogenase E1 component